MTSYLPHLEVNIKQNKIAGVTTCFARVLDEEVYKNTRKVLNDVVFEGTI